MRRNGTKSPNGAKGNGRYRLFVFDLDETLWTLSDGITSVMAPPFRRTSRDRVENDHGFWVELQPGVRELFEFLKRKGGYISIASRNDPGPTLALLEALEIARYLDFPQIAWRPKERSIGRIIAQIRKRDGVSIKPEEVLFIDDWPENIPPVRRWGATAIIFGQDIQSYDELMRLLR